MKLSNRILIGFFVFIFLYLTAAFTEIRFRGNPRLMDDSNSKAETVDISGITHLVLSDLDKRVYVNGSDKDLLEVRSISGDLLQKLEYNISGDTLTLSQLSEVRNKTITISIYLSQKNLKSITINNALVTVDGLKQKELAVKLNSGRINIDTTNTFNNLHVTANKQSNFYMSGGDLDSLTTFLDNSSVIIDSPVRFLEGSAINHSHLSLTGTKEIKIKKDNSSSLKIY